MTTTIIYAIGCENGLIILWDIHSGKRIAILESHKLSINCLKFSSDDNFLCSGSDDYSIRIWDLSTIGNTLDEVISEPYLTFRTKNSRVFSLEFITDKLISV